MARNRTVEEQINISHKQRIKTSAEWDVSTIVLLPGELGCTSDTNVIKVGDGVSLWPSLPAISGGSGNMGYDPTHKRLVL